MRLTKRFIRTIRQNPLWSFFLKHTAYLVARILFATYRLKVTYDTSFKQPLNQHHGIFYFWHQHIVGSMFFFFTNKSSGSCVVSPSNDGKIAGFICKKLGFNVIYGSSNHASLSLVRSCLQVLKQTNQMCLVGDGSRGPAQQLQKGIVYLAEKSCVPLIFVSCKSEWAITFKKSWDHFQIPLPFSTISVHISAPLYPPLLVGQVDTKK